MFYYYDTTILILIPAMLLAAYADHRVRKNFRRYSYVGNSRNMTGAEAARRVLDYNGLNDIRIQLIGGQLSDHYDPSERVLSLSADVYNGTSISAVGVACHEVGHAIQHSRGYIPLKLRNAIVPVTNLASSLTWPMIMIGLMLIVVGNGSMYVLGDRLFNIGALAFVVIILFHLVTLPVEFDASRRAIKCIKEYNLLRDDEVKGAAKVLRAAAMTYIAALAVAVSNLLRILALRDRSE